LKSVLNGKTIRVVNEIEILDSSVQTGELVTVQFILKRNLQFWLFETLFHRTIIVDKNFVSTVGIQRVSYVLTGYLCTLSSRNLLMLKGVFIPIQ
jgi:hypothetical protein